MYVSENSTHKSYYFEYFVLFQYLLTQAKKQIVYILHIIVTKKHFEIYFKKHILLKISQKIINHTIIFYKKILTNDNIFLNAVWVQIKEGSTLSL